VSTGVPGRDDELTRLRRAYTRVAHAGAGGQTLYVTGAPGSGRSGLLRAFADELAQREDDAPAVLAGAFENGRFVAWDDSGPPAERVTAIAEKVVSLPEGLVPYAALIGLALSRGEAPLALVRELFERSDPLAPTELLPLLLRELCGEGPVVVLVDDADRAPGGLWGDAVAELGERVARDRPLLFVLAIERPAQLDRHEDDEPESLYLARRLRGRGRARWLTLDPVTIEQLEAWTGPAAPEVLERLLDVTGGRAAWAADLWRHWRASGVVGEDGTFAEGGRERTLDPFADVFGERLARIARAGAPDADAARIRASISGGRKLLSNAALEGPVFTADALARVLRQDRDAVIDLLDDALLHDDAHPDGFIHEAGSIDVGDEHGRTHHLWLYRFAAELDWLTLTHHGFAEPARRAAAARVVAQALVDVYGGPHYVAATLARLHELAGDGEPARRHRRMADAGSSRDVLLWRAEALLARGDPQESPDRRRAAEILLAAARSLTGSGSHEDGLRYSRAVYRLAPQRADRAEAQYLSGVHQYRLGAYDDARQTLNMALALYRELADRRGEADARAALALIENRRGAREDARLELAFVLEIYREIGDREGEAATRESLAGIEMALGLGEQARANLVAVMRLEQADGDRRAEASTRLRIARLDLEQGDFDRARSELDAALETYRALGDRHGEADTRHNLARLGIELGRLGEARREFMRVLAVYRELGDLVGQAATRHSLASIAIEQRVFEKARRELNHVLTLGREMGDEDVVQTALDGLEVVDAADPRPPG
jgi:tetratricopeptide (TPR) repeat protein